MDDAGRTRFRQRWREKLDPARSGDAWQGRLDLRRRDGSPVAVLMTRAGMDIDDGRATVIVAVLASDVGDAPASDTRSALLASVLSSTGDAIFLKSMTGEILTWNEGAQHVYGYAPEEMIGSNVRRFVPEGYEEELRDIFRRVGDGEVIQGLETRRRRRDGSLVEVSLTISPVRDAEGAIVAISTIARDITRRRVAEAESVRAKHLLDAITAGVADGITVQEANGDLVYANEAAAKLAGVGSLEDFLHPPDGHIIDRFDLLDEAGNPLDLSDLPGRRVLHGQPGSEMVLQQVNRTTGERSWRRVRSEPVLHPDGSVQYAVNIFRDIGDIKRSQDELKESERRLHQEVREQHFLLEASRLLADSLEYEVTIRQIADLAVPAIADWVVVDILDEHGSLQPLAVSHADPQRVVWAEALRREQPPDLSAPRGPGAVVRTGEPELNTDLAPLIEEFVTDPEDLRLIEELELRSSMTVPLAVRGKAFGAITFVGAESGRHFDEDDLLLAEDLAARAALAIDNARIYQERDRIARALQQSLLPSEIPAIGGVEIATRYRATGKGNEVGGDFYDVLDLGADSWGLVIGDVCGKGPDAAAVMGVVRHMVRTAAVRINRPSEILTVTNEAVLAEAADDRFCSACFARINRRPDVATVRATVCSAGHPLPFVLRADGTLIEVGEPGTLIGLFEDMELQDVVVDLGSGDSLILMTDGVSDVAASDDASDARLRKVIGGAAGSSAEDIATTISDWVVEVHGEEPADDVAILVMRVLDV